MKSHCVIAYTKTGLRLKCFMGDCLECQLFMCDRDYAQMLKALGLTTWELKRAQK